MAHLSVINNVTDSPTTGTMQR